MRKTKPKLDPPEEFVVEPQRPVVIGHYPTMVVAMVKPCYIIPADGYARNLRHAFMNGFSRNVTWDEYIAVSSYSSSLWPVERDEERAKNVARGQGFAELV